MSAAPLRLVGAPGEPTPRQRALLVAACALIEAAPQFGRLPGLSFAGAEVNAGLAETERGYLYLRYGGPGVPPQEFWACVGAHPSLNWHTGVVHVPLPPGDAGTSVQAGHG